MIRTGKKRRVTFVVPAHFHAAMAAGIKKGMDIFLAIAAEDNRFFSHARNKEIARIRNLAFMPDEEPCACEEIFQFLSVNLVINKKFPADITALSVDQLTDGSWFRHGS